MSIKDTIKKMTQSRAAGNFVRAGAMGAALLGASVGQGATQTEETHASEKGTMNQYAEPFSVSKDQQDIKDQLQLNQYLAKMGVYDAERDAGIAQDDFASMVKYALQLDAQLACAGENAGTRLAVVSGAVDTVFRPLAGNEEITFGDYSLNPKGLREFWKESGSSFDFSDGLEVVLKYPNSNEENKDKPYFIIDVPQDSLTGSIKEMSGIYNGLEDAGITELFEKSAEGFKNMTPEEQKEAANKFMEDVQNGVFEKKLEGDPVLKDRLQKDLKRLVPSQYTISVCENGQRRPATKEDASLFYDTVAEIVLEMNAAGAIDLGDLAAQEIKKEENGSLWGRLKGGIVSLGAGLASKSMLRRQLDEKMKDQVIIAFHQAIEQPQEKGRDDNSPDTQIAQNNETTNKLDMKVATLSPYALKNRGGR